jgi:SAM-dependent methyltransferase
MLRGLFWHSSRPMANRVLVEVRTELLVFGWRLGLWMPPDRRMLDELILPHYSDRRVLFVGVRRYNAKNRALVRSYATIDPGPKSAAWGGSPHVFDGIENVAKHFAPASFDVVIFNGVIGHGLADRGRIDRAFTGCFRVLRPGGELVVGVNEDAPDFPGIDVPARGKFEPFAFEPLGVERLVVTTPLRERTHTFYFLRRPTWSSMPMRGGKAGSNRSSIVMPRFGL